jgi:hypothetical protein
MIGKVGKGNFTRVFSGLGGSRVGGVLTAKRGVQGSEETGSSQWGVVGTKMGAERRSIKFPGATEDRAAMQSQSVIARGPFYRHLFA